jgi:lipopolysaccharide transport system permease protein
LSRAEAPPIINYAELNRHTPTRLMSVNTETDIARAGARGHTPRRLSSVLSAARRQRDLLIALTESDLRFRYGRGAWRFVRLLLDPFALVGIYLILIVIVSTRPGYAPGLSLACAVVPFQYLMATVTNAMGAVDLRRPILLNMSFRRMFLPISSVLTETVSFGASFAVIAVMMLIYRVAPSPALLWLPLVVVVTAIFSASFAYPASLFGVWFSRGLRPFALSFMRMIFFLGPGLVPLERTSGKTHLLLSLNPLSGLFESFRDLFLYGHRPAAWQLLYPLGFALVLLFGFIPLYAHEQRHFAKVVE